MLESRLLISGDSGPKLKSRRGMEDGKAKKALWGKRDHDQTELLLVVNLL